MNLLPTQAAQRQASQTHAAHVPRVAQPAHVGHAVQPAQPTYIDDLAAHVEQVAVGKHSLYLMVCFTCYSRHTCLFLFNAIQNECF